MDLQLTDEQRSLMEGARFSPHAHLLEKPDVIVGTCGGEKAVFRFRTVPQYQRAASAALQGVELCDGFQLSVPHILHDARAYYIERYAGDTWFDAFRFNEQQGWFTEEQIDTLLHLYYGTRAVWAKVLPLQFGLIKDPIRRVHKWLSTATERGVECGAELELFDELIALGVLDRIMLEPSHGHIFDTHIITGPPRNVALIEFDKVGYYMAGYDLVMAPWFRLLRVDADELDLSLTLQRLDSYVLRVWTFRSKYPDAPLPWGSREAFLRSMHVAFLLRFLGSIVDCSYRLGQPEEHHLAGDRATEERRLLLMRALVSEYGRLVRDDLR